MSVLVVVSFFSGLLCLMLCFDQMCSSVSALQAYAGASVPPLQTMDEQEDGSSVMNTSRCNHKLSEDVSHDVPSSELIMRFC